MNTVTLVATDLDGTFLNSKKEVSKLNREAISALKHKGILFGIASGRPVETVHAMLEDWKIEDSVSFIMGMNGGVIYDIRRRTKEEFHLLDGKIILDIINFYKDMDVIFHVLVGDIRYTSKSTEETRAHAKLFGETEIEVDMESFLKDRTVNKLIIYCDPAYRKAGPPARCPASSERRRRSAHGCDREHAHAYVRDRVHGCSHVLHLQCA